METMSSKKLKSFMIERGIGVNELAKLAGVTNVTISRFMSRDLPVRLPTLSKICKALACNPQDLILDSEGV